MSLAEALRTTPPARKGTRCGAGTLLDRLDPDDRAAADAALTDPDVTATTIATALDAIGHPIASQTLQRHRRGECACPR